MTRRCGEARGLVALALVALFASTVALSDEEQDVLIEFLSHTEVSELGWSGALIPEACARFTGLVCENESIVSIDFSWRQLSSTPWTLPDTLSDLSNLRRLLLPGTNLQGTFPSGLRGLSKLEDLDLSSNAITASIPAWIGELASLRTLDLSAVPLRGALPSTVANLTNLLSLSYGASTMNGTFPIQIGNMTQLRTLEICCIFYNDTLPDVFYNTIHLTSINIAGLSLRGPLPASLFSLANLTTLHLERNRFSGPLPVELGNLLQLTVLSLEENQFSGLIPQAILTLPALQELYLSDNPLTPGQPLPPEFFSSASRIRRLFLENLQLSGPIPDTMANLTFLSYLSLRGNSLTLSGLKRWLFTNRMFYLDLAGTAIGGEMLGTMSSARNMYHLDLSSTNLTGEINSNLTQWATIREVFLGNNSLSGLFPDLTQMSALTDLDLSHNQLQGTIAPLNSLPLRYFSVGYNRLVYSCLPEFNVRPTCSAAGQNSFICCVATPIPTQNQPYCGVTSCIGEGTCAKYGPPPSPNSFCLAGVWYTRSIDISDTEVVVPRSPTGVINVWGNVTFGPSTTMHMPALHGQVKSTGCVTLAGLLNVTYSNAELQDLYANSNGRLTVVSTNASCITGRFSNVTVQNSTGAFLADCFYTVLYSNTTVELMFNQRGCDGRDWWQAVVIIVCMLVLILVIFLFLVFLTPWKRYLLKSVTRRPRSRLNSWA